MKSQKYGNKPVYLCPICYVTKGTMHDVTEQIEGMDKNEFAWCQFSAPGTYGEFKVKTAMNQDEFDRKLGGNIYE